ncbi:unnamed protein product [Paramecium pentaurelia]|uniref:Translation initiation factor IF2/IF5 domain-containing protein n=1 Tax=Paramecium pentaurelia TaxID=43138 RepID=A0A8S1S6H2_9CILI|nr:unnamed protein product [Paramecium pentaurelia]
MDNKYSLIKVDNFEIKQQENKKYYIKALDRLLSQLEKHKLSYTKLQITQPIVQIKGARTIWQNYSQICNQIKMNSKLVNQYFYAQFWGKVSIRNEQMIILGQRIKSKVIQSYLREFLKEQLICQQCKMADTKLVKDRKIKLISKECTTCKATCTVEGSKFKYFKFP